MGLLWVLYSISFLGASALACVILNGMTVTKRTVWMIASYAALVAWAGVIFVLSSEGSDTSSGRSDLIVQAVQSWGVGTETDFLTFLVRKSAHITAYFIFGLLAYNVLRFYSWSTRRTALLAVAIVFTYAISDEFHQSFVPGRSAEVRDVLIDTTAGTVGVGIFALIHSRLNTKRLNKRDT